MSTWHAVIFDLDDTLYPERQYVLSGFRAVAAWAEAQLAIPAAEGFAELRQLFDCGVRGDTYNRWLAARGLLSETYVAEMVRVYRQHPPTLTPFAEVPALVSALRKRYRLGLVSDGYLAVQQRKLAALGLVDHLDAAVFSDTWGRAAWKPSEQPFRAVLSQLGVDASRALYVADNPIKDFLGARRIGMGTVRVRWPEGEYAHLEPPTADHAADVTCASLSELEACVVSLPVKRSITRSIIQPACVDQE